METIEIDGTVLKFDKITLGQEEEWKEWVRSQVIAAARRDADLLELQGKDRAEFLAAVSANHPPSKCSLLSQIGAEHAFTPDGIMQLLRMASAKHHPAPGIDDDTLKRILLERNDEAQLIVIAIYPGDMKKKWAAKKAKEAAGRGDRPPGSP